MSLKAFKWFFIVLPVLNIILFLSGEEKFSNWLPSELLVIAISICILYFCYGRKSTCPECRKLFALKKTKEEIIGQEDVSVLVETKMCKSVQTEMGCDDE